MIKYFISLKSTKLSEQEISLLKNPSVSGVVLYIRNILGKETTKKFICEIKSVKPDLKIAIDEEGGFVSRFTHLIANYSQPYIATLPIKEVKNYYKMRSRFLKDVGIDINLAPVVDIAMSEDSYLFRRSYSSDLNKIIELASICVDEQKQAGLLSCIKHFPGHGRAKEDSHEKLPVVNISEKEWNGLEFKIFKNIIDIGIEYVMVGHLLFPKINSQISSVSNFWINNILKKKLNFKGTVISDDICMKGLSESIDTSSSENFVTAGLNELIITDQKHPILKGIALLKW